MTMQKQKGFTLIELVVVIVILGILAVTAAPKFLNIQDEAKVSALQGLSGGMRGALAMTYTQAIMENEESKKDGSIKVEGNDVALAYGYPKAAADLAFVVTGLEDWNEKPEGTTAPAGATTHWGYPNFDCVVAYTAATDSKAASVSIVGDAEGCGTPATAS